MNSRLTYFKFKGKDSNDFGIVVSEYPPITRAKKREETVELPGRSGTLTLLGNGEVYEEKEMICSCFTEPNTDFNAIFGWLNGSGDLELGNDSDFIYSARILDEVRLLKNVRGSLVREFDLFFICQPFKRLKNAEENIVITNSGEVVQNIGHVASRPRVKIEGAGDITINFGAGCSFGIKDMTEPIVIDGDLCLSLDESLTQNMSHKVSGDLPLCPSGSFGVSWTGNVSKITITPRWRFL